MINRIYRFIQTQLITEGNLEYFTQEGFVKNLEKLKEIEGFIQKMHDEVRDYQFTSLQEEIFFFKKVKPLVVKEYVFMTWLKKLHEQYTCCALQNKDFLKKQVLKAAHFFEEEKELVRYMKRNESYNDERYFTRLKSGEDINEDYGINLDARITSSHGFVWAKLLAYQKIEHYCVAYLTAKKEKVQQQEIKNTAMKLKWTATRTDAAELLYALYFSGAVNYGDATVQKLAAVFDSVFETQLSGTIYRDFIDIKNRKKESAKFLNKLLTRFNDQLDERFA